MVSRFKRAKEGSRIGGGERERKEKEEMRREERVEWKNTGREKEVDKIDSFTVHYTSSIINFTCSNSRHER